MDDIRVIRDNTGIWVADCIDLPVCIGQGETQQSAITDFQHAKVSYSAVLQNYNEPSFIENNDTVALSSVELPSISPKLCCRALATSSFKAKLETSTHFTLLRSYLPTVVTVPKQDLVSPGTINAIINQAAIPDIDFCVRAGRTQELIMFIVGPQCLSNQRDYNSHLFPIAVGSNNIEAVKILLDQGASVIEYKSDNYVEFNALTSAAFNGYTDLVKLFLSIGMDVNSFWCINTTALHEACMMRCGHDCSAWDHDEKWGDEADVARFNATVAVLLAAGADVNAICFDWPGPQYDYTPLQFAVESRNLQIVKMLVEHGADMNIKESDGRTALEIAYEFKKMGPQWEKEYNQKYEMDGIIEYLESVMK